MPNQLHNPFCVQTGKFSHLGLYFTQNINRCSHFSHMDWKQFYVLWKRFSKALTGIIL